MVPPSRLLPRTTSLTAEPRGSALAIPARSRKIPHEKPFLVKPHEVKIKNAPRQGRTKGSRVQLITDEVHPCSAALAKAFPIAFFAFSLFYISRRKRQLRSSLQNPPPFAASSCGGSSKSIQSADWRASDGLEAILRVPVAASASFLSLVLFFLFFFFFGFFFSRGEQKSPIRR